MPMINESFLDLELCEGTVTTRSGKIVTEVIDLSIEEEANCDVVLAGGELCYTATITNNSEIEFADITFRNPIAQNAQYNDGTFTIKIGNTQPTHETPTIDPSTNVLKYELTIPAKTTVIIEFCVTVQSG